MMLNSLPPQALDIVELLKNAFVNPKEAATQLAALGQILKEIKEAQTQADATAKSAADALKQAQKFDGQAKANAIARDNSLNERESKLSVAEADYVRKNETHDLSLQAHAASKAELSKREGRCYQRELAVEKSHELLTAREAALGRREKALNDFEAKNQADAADLEQKKQHLAKLLA